MIENKWLSEYVTEEVDSKERQFINEVLNDYWICCISRETSILGRKEVLTGKAKFGILGDGKEVAQVAMARAFKKGDFRSGYYRDQTFVMALGLCELEDYFAQLYADTENDPFSAGRQMNAHFSSRLVDQDGNWTTHKDLYNISADISSTGGQMARALGLALASKRYRENETLKNSTVFSNQGNEVVFCTIGDASTSEGVFWETVNAAGVMQVPLAISVWDDGYGISVPTEKQTTKGNISEVLEGFRLNEEGKGIDIYVCKGWDYPSLCEMYEKGIKKVRATHIPALFHVRDLTQPQGHSTSGSHERYKDQARLSFEKEYDCIVKMREWIIDNELAPEAQLDEIQVKAKNTVREAKNRAWNNFYEPVVTEIKWLTNCAEQLVQQFPQNENLKTIHEAIRNTINPNLSELVHFARNLAYENKDSNEATVLSLNEWIALKMQSGKQRYGTHLYSNSPKSALKVPVVAPAYASDAPVYNGYEIINRFFDLKLEQYPELYAFGEDVGKIGDVNQGFMNMQAKYGEDRVFDAGIREWTIIGQAIGMAMRGLRPIAEMQYLDYLIYGLTPLSDDLATLRWRSAGIQQAPAIIRTRGHRLEGIWHAGSPMSMMLGSLRGIYLLTPRNFVQAAGMYNTILQSDDPAIIVECLNSYRHKEKLPHNLNEITVPLGVPEILRKGSDLTLVTYGSLVSIADEAVNLLARHGISVELIDVQTLLPFDLEHIIVQSLKKTNKVLFCDEDVPGGATAYMMREVLEVQKGYQYLDCPPQTLTATAHRPPYGSDGDYFSKPNREDIFEKVWNMMHESDPGKWGKRY